MKYFSTIALVALCATLIQPLHTYAASSQTLANQAIAKLYTQGTNQITGTLDYTQARTPLYKDLESSSISLDLGFRMTEDSTTPANKEFSVDLKKLTAKTGARTALNLEKPMDIDFLTHASTSYIRLTNAKSLQEHLLGGASLPTSSVALFDEWLSFDSMDANDPDTGVLVSEASSLKQVFASNTNMLVRASDKGISPVIVQKTERVKGQPTQRRLSAKVNPALLTFAQKEELAAVGKDTAAQKKIRERYTRAKAMLPNVRIVLVIDTAKTPTLLRIEFSQVATEMIKGCAYTKTDRTGVALPSSYRCNINTYKETVTSRGGINFAKVAATVSAPTSSVPFKTALNALIAAMFE